MTDPGIYDSPANFGLHGKFNMRLWCGHALIGLGLMGVLLPLVPTTVFLIGAAMCYAKSSPKLYQRLVNHPRFGLAIRNYLDHGVISRRGKWAANISLSISAAILCFSPLNQWAMFAGLMGIMIASIFIVTRPSGIESL